ncbi:ABC transporter ATP-binding protein [Proteus mirabilis]|uniref:ABC transporter ATP-binding protein n=1 Tax=Proteus mirabilis TaxID=584 RepID=UPI0018C7DFFC|nr:ABC transporter ATP-binding protein [Proteus mirabilis]MBG6017324.1 ABC transporter ATP-binding protein [Proteus mirabilis]MBU9977488.1 ABC transporter ATP-binding protein [Proteus mirabilis]MDX4948454.1 ABC transporter ATP-binding protein [Proteus mirabilis]
MNKAPLIEVDNLCIDFPSARVVNNVSFRLGQERLALVGESGSGKSMTARSLMGLVRKPGKVSANKLHFMGDDLLTYSPKQWNQLRGKTISMVLQDPRYALNPVKTIYQQVEETVKLHQKLSHKERYALITETLLSVGLPEQSIYRYPGELSGGMGQRAMIAIALINNPTVLIADEPTSALDAQLRHQILELIITQCAQRDMALLLISHDLPLVAEYCDRVMVMYQGEQVDELEAKALPQAIHPYTRTLWTCRPNASTYGTQLPVLDRTLNFKGTPYAN